MTWEARRTGGVLYLPDGRISVPLRLLPPGGGRLDAPLVLEVHDAELLKQQLAQLTPPSEASVSGTPTPTAAPGPSRRPTEPDSVSKALAATGCLTIIGGLLFAAAGCTGVL